MVTVKDMISLCLIFGIFALIVGVSQTSLFTPSKVGTSGVMASAELELNITKIDWGIVEPNSITYRGLSIKNVGNIPINLSFSTANYDPVNGTEFFVVGWSYKDTLLNAGELIELSLSLYVKPEISGVKNFSFDIMIMERKKA